MNPADSSTPEEGPSNAPIPFSLELRAMEEKFRGHPARLSEILAATKGRGFELLLIFVSIPFLTPIPLPGLSSPFGLVIAFLGARLALGQRPWLPQWLLARQVPSGFLSKLLHVASRVARFLELFLRPRLLFFQESLTFRRVAGTLTTLCGLLLLLPLPVPLSNFFPAATVVLLAAGAMERDGLFFLAGCVMFALTAGFFVLLGFGGVQAIEGIRRAF